MTKPSNRGVDLTKLPLDKMPVEKLAAVLPSDAPLHAVIKTPLKVTLSKGQAIDIETGSTKQFDSGEAFYYSGTSDYDIFFGGIFEGDPDIGLPAGPYFADGYLGARFIYLGAGEADDLRPEDIAAINWEQGQGGWIMEPDRILAMRSPSGEIYLLDDFLPNADGSVTFDLLLFG